MNSNLSPIDWAKRPIQKYADFSGRAPRAEYWWFVLAVLIVEMVAMMLDSMLGMSGMIGPYGPLLSLLMLGLLIPSIAVGIRRLHDTGRSGWWLLISLIPIIGAIVLIVFLATPGDKGENQHGPDPYGQDLATTFA
jgi:uncharacterized membrane protein YhaH (DUF805 family)